MNETAEWPPEPPKKKKPIEQNVLFSAKLIWCWKCIGKQVGKTYFVIARGQGLHVDVYSNAELTNMLGCYPVHWFENFEHVGDPPVIEILEVASDQVVEENIFDQPEEPQFFEQMKLF